EPIDARRQDGLNGLGQRDLLDRGHRRIRTTLAAQRAVFDEGANDLLDEEGIAARPGLDPGAERREPGVGSEPVVEQRRAVPGGERRQRDTLVARLQLAPVL